MTILLLGNINKVYASLSSEYELLQIPWVFGVHSDSVHTSALLVDNMATSMLSSIDVSADIESSYSIRYYLWVDNITPHAIVVDRELISVVAAIDVEADTSIRFDIGRLYRDTRSKFSLLAPVSINTSVKYDLSKYIDYVVTGCSHGLAVSSDLVSKHNIRGMVNSDLHSYWLLKSELQSVTDCGYDLAVTNKVESTLRGVYTLYDPTSEDIVTTVSATINGTGIDFDTLNLTQDDASFCWAFTGSLSNLESWSRCSIGSELTIAIGTDNYIVEIDSRDKVTRFGEEDYTISGRSKVALYSDSIGSIYTTWDATTAHAAMSEVIPTQLNIGILDWALPSGVLTSDGETPIALVSRIALAAGGIVYTSCDGILNVVPKHKVAPADYDIAFTDHSVSDLDDIYSISETGTKKPGYNQVEVSDEPDNDSSSINIDVISTDTVQLEARVKVAIYPFVPTLTLQSSHDGVTISPSIEELIEELTETIEIIAGAGSTAKPVFSIVAYDYMDADMGLVSFSGSSLKTEIKGTTLVRVVYLTKYHSFTVTATEAESTQIYTEE